MTAEQCRRRRRWGVVLVALGVLLAAASAGPLAWGFGIMLATGFMVGGWHLVTDHPARPRRRRA